MMETKRLRIRRFRAEDGAGLHAYLSDPAVVRYEPYAPKSREECDAQALYMAENDSFWAVCLKDGMLIGQLYLHKEECETWELGYVFHGGYQGQGYATEAVRRLLEEAFSAWNAHRVVAYCNPENAASWRLLERLGMRREAHKIQDVYFFKDAGGKPVWQDTYGYALLKTEWEEQA